MPTRKIPAERSHLYAVYFKSYVLGSPMRAIRAAFPKLEDCEKWIEAATANKLNFCKREDFMIEDIAITMKSWNPYEN